MKSRIIVAVAGRYFYYQANWGHCKAKDSCSCGGAGLFRIPGIEDICCRDGAGLFRYQANWGIAKLRIIADVVEQLFF